MRNQALTKTFIASGAIAKRRIVKLIAAENSVSLASAVGDRLIGVSDDAADIEDGRAVDVIFQGIVEVEAGAAINKGAAVTTNAQGKAVATSAGTDNVIGFALDASSVDGDVISIEINKH
ncbi:hypothetical protein tloyanaT_13130 [Thalassotalea loyana]|uniref:DUF2190 domain-containing protein n=1 Tax=Thalassotalea loyana TaxID=280483 RepID=A0ABQ6HAB3_9GAMM|nr:DUF2190 family protein [Thalassotalea loyana]GLX85061.1 hypothetical protein tloyanaT_13130 [Thalassotalea loyana]